MKNKDLLFDRKYVLYCFFKCKYLCFPAIDDNTGLNSICFIEVTINTLFRKASNNILCSFTLNLVKVVE